MDLDNLFGGSFVNWEAVAGSWTKRTISSRLLLLAARRYLSGVDEKPDAGRAEDIGTSLLPDEVQRAYATPPRAARDDASAQPWGAFIDAALVAELEIVSYGERPPLLNELRVGLDRAASEAGDGSDLARWFTARREALPGEDLPEDPEYLPV